MMLLEVFWRKGAVQDLWGRDAGIWDFGYEGSPTG